MRTYKYMHTLFCFTIWIFSLRLTMEFKILMLICATAQSCILYPEISNIKEVIFCQGPNIKEFPLYQPDTVRYIRYIALLNTAIECVRLETEDYLSLEYFHEVGNDLLECACINDIRRQMQTVLFNTTCTDVTSMSSVSTVEDYTTMSTTAHDDFRTTEAGTTEQGVTFTQDEDITTSSHDNITGVPDEQTSSTLMYTVVGSLVVAGAAATGVLLLLVRLSRVPRTRTLNPRYWERTSRRPEAVGGELNPNYQLPPFSMELDVMSQDCNEEIETSI